MTSNKCKQVLCLLPVCLDKQALLQCAADGSEDESPRYNFHWLEEPNLPKLFEAGSVCDPTLSGRFDAVKYLERAFMYTKDHEIDAVFFSSDFGGFLASVICAHTGLPGPSIESQFLCIHKYYNRKTEPSKLWCEALDLDNEDEWCGPHIKYPCFIKPPCLFWSVCQFIVQNESELRSALTACKRELTPWFQLLCPVFEKYVDATKYPLILKNIVVAEELVEGSIHCIEGWADDRGELHVWLTTDNSYFSKPEKTGDAYIVPSQLPHVLQRDLESVVFGLLRNYGFKNTFFNVEFWCRENGKRIDIVEINNRICYSYFAMQCKLFATTSYHGALYLCCGEIEKVKEASTMIRRAVNARVGGMFLVCLHLRQTAKVNAILNFDELKRVESGEIKDVGSTTIDFDEEFTIRPIASGGLFIGHFYAFKSSLKELFAIGDNIRSKLLKDHSLLGYEREKSYLELAMI